MKTKISRLILALVCLMTASTALAEGIDLKELRYMFENHWRLTMVQRNIFSIWNIRW